MLDVKRNRPGAYELWTHNATRKVERSPIDVAREMQAAGAEEIAINCIDRDGVMKGYDLAIVTRIREAITTPMSVLGGAGTLDDIGTLIEKFGVIGAAAGRMVAMRRAGAGAAVTRG